MPGKWNVVPYYLRIGASVKAFLLSFDDFCVVVYTGQPTWTSTWPINQSPADYKFCLDLSLISFFCSITSYQR